MFLKLAALLFVLWVGSFVLFKTAGLLLHLLLVVALLSLVMHLIASRRAVR